jgi:hypothetical protein
MNSPNDLVRERIQLQTALRKINQIIKSNSSSSDKEGKIKLELDKVKSLIEN